MTKRSNRKGTCATLRCPCSLFCWLPVLAHSHTASLDGACWNIARGQVRLLPQELRVPGQHRVLGAIQTVADNALVWSSVVGCVMLGLSLLLWWSQADEQPVSLRPLPSDQPLVNADCDPHFRARGQITLHPADAPGRRPVTFEVVIENQTDEPIKGLVMTAQLSEALRSWLYSGGRRLAFGHDTPIDLVPGQEPYGVISSLTDSVPDPHPMSSVERQRLYEALRQPIRVGLWWAGGEAFLELPADSISLVGFPPP